MFMPAFHANRDHATCNIQNRAISVLQLTQLQNVIFRITFYCCIQFEVSSKAVDTSALAALHPTQPRSMRNLLISFHVNVTCRSAHIVLLNKGIGKRCNHVNVEIL
jgi:capsular polysaccharide biosynthesis protein